MQGGFSLLRVFSFLPLDAHKEILETLYEDFDPLMWSNARWTFFESFFHFYLLMLIKR